MLLSDDVAAVRLDTVSKVYGQGARAPSKLTLLGVERRGTFVNATYRVKRLSSR